MAHDGLRGEVELAVLEAVKAAGPGGKVNRAAIVRAFKDRGIGRTQCFAWIAALLEDHDAGAPRLADASVAPPPPALPSDTAAEAQAVAEAVVPMEHGGSAGRSLAIVQHLERLIQDVLRVRSVAHHADGRVRNSNLVLKSAEALRRSLETAAKLQAGMYEAAELERMCRELIGVVQAESPELAQRVLKVLDKFAIRWGG